MAKEAKQAKEPKQYTDLADKDRDEGFVDDEDPGIGDQIIDDRQEIAELARERGGTQVIGDDIPITSLEDLEKRDRLRIAAGQGVGPSNDVLQRLNYIPSGGLKLQPRDNREQRMHQILAKVGPDKFAELVKDGLI